MLKLKRSWIPAVSVLFLASCSKDAADPTPTPGDKDLYVVQVSEGMNSSRGYIMAFDSIPEGQVVVSDSVGLEGEGMQGWRPFENWVFKKNSTTSNQAGIERLSFRADGAVRADRFLEVNGSVPGSGNFVIANRTLGFYWDAASPLRIHKFNPETMEPSGEIDLTEAVQERGMEETEIRYRSVGQRLLALHKGKLLAGISYQKSDSTSEATGQQFYPAAHIAVIDIASGSWEKTLVVEDLELKVSDQSYSEDANGDLYLAGYHPQGDKVVRIIGDSTTADTSWNWVAGESYPEIASIYARDGKLTTLLGMRNGASAGWEYHVLDPASGNLVKIEGVPAVTAPGEALSVFEVDGRTYLRVVAQDGSVNGFYELQGNQATEAFTVGQGGIVQGFYKVKSD